jgi:hypothetical protein
MDEKTRNGKTTPRADRAPGEATGRSIYTALASARAEFAKAAKDGQNPHLKNRYPTLASIVEACDEALARHGLTYSQPIVQTPAGPALRTVLVHLESGERIEGDCPLLFDSSSRINPMQALGSAITYARRYSLEALLGLMREDDDAEGAFPRPRREPVREGPPRRQTEAPRAPRPFAAWARSAAEQLGIHLNQLVNHLHNEAVRQGHLAAVEPDQRLQALARRYHDRQKGREWRDWMRAECKSYQSRMQENAAAEPSIAD